MTDTTPHRAAARKMPGALSSSVIDSLGSTTGGTSFIDAMSPKPGDAITSWMTSLGPGTLTGPGAAMASLIDAGNYTGPGAAMASLIDAGNAFDGTSFIDAMSPKPGDAITSWMTSLGLDTVGPNMNAFIDAVSPTPIDDLIGAPWIKELGGGGGTHGFLLDDALSPTSLVEEISPSIETVDVPEFSASTLPVATNPPAPVYGGLSEKRWI